ncbi:MAG: BMP family ABC transporter substrate-binding protein [Eubacteriales bacterium]|nr:BMP family ABC transporter substrate-binding protein [Eubacteriales bacterium]
MSREDYIKAHRLAKKDYQAKSMRGELPTLPVLDDILPPRGQYREVPLGLVKIPVAQIVGTKNAGRSNAFSSNFMPLLKDGTEFAGKWASLSTSHIQEGIREPIKAYEYMNRFYVEEGNKRVSVVKFFDVVDIPGNVTRIIPNRTNDKENRIYYEFIDFYELSQVNYVWFSEPGRFVKLQEAVGKGPEEVWSDENRLDFKSIYTRFAAEFRSRNNDKLKITVGDAFLAFTELYDYREIRNMSTAQLKKLIVKSWEEFVILEKDAEIELKMNPSQEKKPLINKILPTGVLQAAKSRLKIAFIYEKTPSSSAWTYGHELGRMHLEQKFPNEVKTMYYTNITRKNIECTIEDAVKQRCDIIFTTTPSFAPASVKAAIAHPSVRILNCSLNTSHRYIRTYYIRMHESKFLMGAIAGALTENDKLGYIADYPIFGTIANINAFALGAKLVNPRVKVYLDWSTKKDVDAVKNLREQGVSIISDRDMVTPEDASRYFGLYILENGWPKSLAMPVWHWGRFYEQLIRTIMDGTWKYDDNPADKKAINYWWGMSSDVADIICSKNLPIGTKRLVELLKSNIKSGLFNPFAGELYSQTGVIQNDPDQVLSPEEVVKMEWLAENIIGDIPKRHELQKRSESVVLQQGIEKMKGK